MYIYNLQDCKQRRQAFHFAIVEMYWGSENITTWPWKTTALWKKYGELLPSCDKNQNWFSWTDVFSWTCDYYVIRDFANFGNKITIGWNITSIGPNIIFRTCNFFSTEILLRLIIIVVAVINVVIILVQQLNIYCIVSNVSTHATQRKQTCYNSVYELCYYEHTATPATSQSW